ncbi:hypothetical protein Dform_01126 [Dehalogenimonas formicexedens]|uniref:Uncharacterized protein n=1 Tax=Dehalogenimonas formicexedens TaxID=1839801 RepID=A0A1P8F7N4_9CHLR|nr:hypothetical protein [Dehalogenimonas formicexedens]APV44460.1 hypothetical protein Dform_01126 [Dehalogenimonas formicexedens]
MPAMIRKPETLFLSKVMKPECRIFPDGVILDNLDGTTLKQAIVRILDELASSTSRRQPRFSEHVKFVALSRYGLDNGVPSSFGEIGKAIGLGYHSTYHVFQVAMRYFRLPVCTEVLRKYIKDEPVVIPLAVKRPRGRPRKTPTQAQLTSTRLRKAKVAKDTEADRSLSAKTMSKPEILFMSAIFQPACVIFSNEQIAEGVAGLTLNQAIMLLFDELASWTPTNTPKFRFQAKSVVSLYFGLEDGKHN